MLEVNFNKKLWHFDLDLQMSVDNQILVLWGAFRFRENYGAAVSGRSNETFKWPN